MESQHSQGRQKKEQFSQETHKAQRFIVRTTTDIYFTIKQISVKYVHWSESDNYPEESNINDLFILIPLFCDT